VGVSKTVGIKVGEINNVRKFEIKGVKIWYRMKNVRAEVVKVEPPLESMSKTQLYDLIKYINRRDVLIGLIVHDLDIPAIRFASLVKKELERKVGGDFLKLLSELSSIEIFYKDPEKVRSTVEDVINEYEKIPLRYRSFFKDDIEIYLKRIEEKIAFERKRIFRWFDEEIKECQEDLDKRPIITDLILETFYRKLEWEVSNECYQRLEICDILEQFVRVMRMLMRGVITIRVRVDPEIVKKLLRGDFTDVIKEVEEKLKRVIM